MIGDVIGKPGRDAVRALLPDLKHEKSIDFVICNGENTAGGYGITADTAAELLDSGVDVLTSGDHIWDKKEIIPLMDEGLPLIRPANYPDAPGKGHIYKDGGDRGQPDGPGVHGTVGLPIQSRRRAPGKVERRGRKQSDHRGLPC